jgi:hypothetical protein
VCTWEIGPPVATAYISEVTDPAPELMPGTLVPAFRSFVKARYGLSDKTGGSASCVYQFSRTDAEALKNRYIAKPPGGYEVVNTGWRYDAQPRDRSTQVVNQPAVAAPAQKGSVFYVCYVNLLNATGYLPNQSTYFTDVFAVKGDFGVGGPFPEYVEKKYSLRSAGPAGCSHSWNQSAVEAALQKMLAQARAGGHIAIETGWTNDRHQALMAGLPKNPAPAASAVAAAKSETTVSTVPKSPQPVDDADGETYSFCYCVGSMAGPAAAASRPHYYVTAIFASSPALQPQGAFSKMLRAAHPRENLGGTVCSTPQSMRVTQIARTNQVNKAQAQYSIVEVPWKP